MAYSHSQSQSQSTSDFAIDDHSISASIGNELAQTARAIHGRGVVADLIFQESQDETSDLDDNIVDGNGAGEGAGDGGHESDDEDPRRTFIDATTGAPDDEEKGKKTLFYSGEEVKLKGKEIDALYGSSMILFIKVDVDGPPNNDNTKREMLRRLREKYVNAAEKHNAAVADIIVHNDPNGYADSGFDIYAPFDQDFTGGELGKKLNFHLQCAAYEDEYTPCGYYMYPRSSISKTPLRLANSVGIIDSGYRGNLMAALDCHLPAGEKYTVNSGVRLAQICAPNLMPFIVKVVDNLDDTTRGAGGFGSTGV